MIAGAEAHLHRNTPRLDQFLSHPLTEERYATCYFPIPI